MHKTSDNWILKKGFFYLSSHAYQLSKKEGKKENKRKNYFYQNVFGSLLHTSPPPRDNKEQLAVVVIRLPG